MRKWLVVIMKIHKIHKILVLGIGFTLLVSVCSSCSIDMNNHKSYMIGDYNIKPVSSQSFVPPNTDIPPDYHSNGNGRIVSSSDISGKMSSGSGGSMDNSYPVNIPAEENGGTPAVVYVKPNGQVDELSTYGKSNPVFDISKTPQDWLDAMGKWGGAYIATWTVGGVEKSAVHFSQSGDVWSGLAMKVNGVSNTISLSACGPSSLAMISSTLLHRLVNPAEAAYYWIDNGLMSVTKNSKGTYGLSGAWSGPESMATAYGLYCNSFYGEPDDSLDAIKKAVNGTNCMAIVSGTGNSKNTPYTTSGHFIVIADYDQSTGEYIVINSRNGVGSPTRYSEDAINCTYSGVTSPKMCCLISTEPFN